jgi:hypothetical protein
VVQALKRLIASFVEKFHDLDQSHNGWIERRTSSLAPPLSTTGPKIFLVASLTHSGPFVTKSKKPDDKKEGNQDIGASD